MSAEELGRSLLGDVEVEGLDELLSTLRFLRDDGRSSHFGIPEFDALIPVAEPPSLPPPQPRLEPWEPPQAPNAQTGIVKSKGEGSRIIELFSPVSGGGKSHLVYYMTTLAVLPKTFLSHPLSGKNSTIAVLDTDNRFHVHRLSAIMANYVIFKLKETNTVDPTSQETTTAITSLIKRSLCHVHIFRPQSHASLLATLEALPSYLFDTQAHSSSRRPLHAIHLDSTTTFHASIRADAETSSSSAHPPASIISDAYSAVATQLSHLSHSFSCPILAITSPLSSTQSLRSNLPASWGKSVDVRLVVRRVPVPGFAPGMSVMEAEGERGQRAEVVDRGRFEVWRVAPGSSGGGFVFRILDKGVVIEREGEG